MIEHMSVHKRVVVLLVIVMEIVLSSHKENIMKCCTSDVSKMSQPSVKC
jgi:hypothetical protein